MKRLSILAAGLLLAGVVHAQTAADNAKRCADANQGVKDSMAEAMKRMAPQQDPGSYVQNTYDIKGIMATDTTSGLSKLLSGNWQSMLNSLINKGVQGSVDRGSQTFSSRMNSLLGSYGASANTYAPVSNWGSALSTSVATPTYAQTQSFVPVQQPATAAVPAQQSVRQLLGPYARPGQTGTVK